MENLLQKEKVAYMYKPLPESLTIKQSGIDGLGLYRQGRNRARIPIWASDIIWN